MSTSVDTAFVKQYERETILVFQREGSFLLPAVRSKDVQGTSTFFQKIGTGVATTKARNGAITPMNQSHTAVECTMSDFYAGDWHDKLDDLKINHNEREAISKSGAYALGRKVDSQLVTEFDNTSQSAITITVTSKAAVLAGMLEWVEQLNKNDVPNDGQRYGIITPRLWSQLQTVQEFSSADWVGADGRPLDKGAPISMRWKPWNGVMWKVHTDSGMGVATATAKGWVWHKSAIGYGKNAAITADVTWHGDRAAWFINHMMSGGAKLIDDAGVIEGTWNDTTAIATS